MERQKELPKIKICLFKATTVASGGGEQTHNQTVRQTVVLCKIMQWNRNRNWDWDWNCETNAKVNRLLWHGGPAQCRPQPQFELRFRVQISGSQATLRRCQPANMTSAVMPFYFVVASNSQPAFKFMTHAKRQATTKSRKKKPKRNLLSCNLQQFSR